MAEDDTSLATYFIETWKGMLRVFLGWSDRDVMRWAARFHEFMDNPDDIFYHESPQYWIKRLLIPEELRVRLTLHDLIRLEGRILAAFNDEHHYYFPLAIDWRPYRSKIDSILSEYGAHLPPLLEPQVGEA